MKCLVVSILLVLFLHNASAQEWQKITGKLLEQVDDTTFQNDAFNRKVGALVVQPRTGDVYLVLNGKHPIYRSKNQGKSWKALRGTEIQGRSYGGFATSIDYTSLRMAFFMIVQKAQTPAKGILLAANGKPLAHIGKPPHDGWTWGMPAWEQEPLQVLLAKEHHAWVVMWKSTDGGNTWEKLDFESRNPGVISEQIFVAGNDDGIYRSTDQGENWEKVSDFIVNGKIPIRYGGNFYWTAPEGVLRSSDDGKTWQALGQNLPGALWGPYFGSREDELMVVNSEGFFISHNGAQSWEKVADFFAPPDAQFEGKYNVMHPTNSYGWDPKRKIIYVAGLGGDAYTLKYSNQINQR